MQALLDKIKVVIFILDESYISNFTIKYGGFPPIADPLEDLWFDKPNFPLERRINVNSKKQVKDKCSKSQATAMKNLALTVSKKKQRKTRQNVDSSKAVHMWHLHLRIQIS